MIQHTTVDSKFKSQPNTLEDKLMMAYMKEYF